MFKREDAGSVSSSVAGHPDQAAEDAGKRRLNSSIVGARTAVASRNYMTMEPKPQPCLHL